MRRRRSGGSVSDRRAYIRLMFCVPGAYGFILTCDLGACAGRSGGGAEECVGNDGDSNTCKVY